MSQKFSLYDDLTVIENSTSSEASMDCRSFAAGEEDQVLEKVGSRISAAGSHATWLPGGNSGWR